MDPAKDPNEKLSYGGYVVAVLDILGQREAIRNLAKFQHDAHDESEVIRALQDSLGVRNGVRDMVRSTFDQFMRVHEDPRFAMLTDWQRAGFSRVNHRAIKTYSFGDTVVAYAPAITPDGDPSIRDIYGIISACALVMLGTMAVGKPVRGAIELGFGLEPETNEVYGPAFLSAYELEQHVAQHPRVVIGDELASYLEYLCTRPVKSEVDTLIADLARSCQRLIDCDEDGCVFVDYLSDGLREMAETTQHDTKVFDKGFEFVRREQERFIKERNPKLAARYAALVRYFHAKASARRKPN